MFQRAFNKAFNIKEEDSVFHENQAFNGKADQQRFLKMYQQKGFHEILDYGETKFAAIRKEYGTIEMFHNKHLEIREMFESSPKLRQMGNESFFKKDYKEALDCYQGALCLAKNDLTRSICYGNMSAVYAALKNPLACIENIKMGRKLHKSNTNAVDKFLEKLKNREESVKGLPNVPKFEDLNLSFPEYEEIPGLAETVGIKEPHTKNQHLYAKEGMKFGDVIAVTESILVGVDHKTGKDLGYCCTSEKSHICLTCGISSFDLVVPCNECGVQFCSEACRNANTFHKLECDMYSICQFKYETEKTMAMKLAYKFLKAEVDTNVSYTSCFDWKDKGASLSDQAKSIMGFRDSVVRFDDAFLLTKRALGLRDMIRRNKDYKNFVGQIKGGEEAFWDLYGQIYKKMSSGSFYNNYCEAMRNESDNIQHYQIYLDWLHGMFKHSCFSNVMVFSPNHSNKNYYILIDDVKAGEELTIGYLKVDCTMDKAQRQNVIKSKFGFTCTCVGCRKNIKISTICTHHLADALVLLKFVDICEETIQVNKVYKNFINHINKNHKHEQDMRRNLLFKGLESLYSNDN